MKAYPLLALVLASCTSELPRESRELCGERVIGDPSAPIEIQIVSRDQSGHVRDIGDEPPREIPLSTGQRGLALGVRARNLDGCAVSVAMRSPEREEIRGGTLVQLDRDGRPDPDDPLQFVELASATPYDVIDVLLQDATGRWAATSYVP